MRAATIRLIGMRMCEWHDSLAHPPGMARRYRFFWRYRFFFGNART